MKSEIKILLIASYLNVFAYGLFSPLYAVFVQGFDENLLTISNSLGVYALFQGLVMMIFGRIEDRFKNKRPIVVLGYFLLSLGALSFAFVTSVTQLYIALTINAIAYGIILPAWKAIYSQAEDKGKEAQEWSLFDGGNLVLASLAAFAGGYLVLILGFKTLFLLVFVIQLFAALFSVKLLKKHT